MFEEHKRQVNISGGHSLPESGIFNVMLGSKPLLFADEVRLKLLPDGSEKLLDGVVQEQTEAHRK